MLSRNNFVSRGQPAFIFLFVVVPPEIKFERALWPCKTNNLHRSTTGHSQLQSIKQLVLSEPSQLSVVATQEILSRIKNVLTSRIASKTREWDHGYHFANIAVGNKGIILDVFMCINSSLR